MLEMIIVLAMMSTPAESMTWVPDSTTLVVCESVALPCNQRTCSALGARCPRTDPLVLPSPTGVPTFVEIRPGSCVASGFSRQPPHGASCWCMCSDGTQLVARCELGETASER